MLLQVNCMAFHIEYVGCFPGDCHLPNGKWPQQKRPEVHSEVQNWGGMTSWREGHHPSKRDIEDISQEYKGASLTKRTTFKHLSPPEKTSTSLHSVSPERLFLLVSSPSSSVSTLEEAASWVNKREQQSRQKNQEANYLSPFCYKGQPEGGRSWWKEGPLEKTFNFEWPSEFVISIAEWTK